MKSHLLSAFIILFLTFLLAGCKKDNDETSNDPGNNPGINSGTITDIDGNQYKTVAIGDQVWMAQDLMTTHYNDGTPISNDTSGLYIPDSSNLKAGYSLGNKYFNIVGHNICPAGWHLPSKQEWRDLIGFVAHDSNGLYGGYEATALKATDGWIENGNGIDAYGFAARAGGVYLSETATIIHTGEAGYWLSSDGAYNGPWIRNMWHYKTTVSETTASWKNGYSIRCMKDQ